MSINIHSKPPEDKYIHKPQVHIEGPMSPKQKKRLIKELAERKKKKGRK